MNFLVGRVAPGSSERIETNNLHEYSNNKFFYGVVVSIRGADEQRHYSTTEVE